MDLVDIFRNAAMRFADVNHVPMGNFEDTECRICGRPFDDPLHLGKGPDWKAPNGECPVCGTMAKDPDIPIMGLRMVRCANCNCAFFMDKEPK